MIRGFFQPGAEDSPTPFVLAAVNLPGVATWKLMPVFVDTKAARTVIHPRDAAELLLISRKLLLSPQAAWGTAQPAGGIGGGALYYGIAGSIGFTDTRAAVDMLDVIFGLALPTPANAAIPSLLGWDVLRHFELRTNWPERIVQLDRV